MLIELKQDDIYKLRAMLCISSIRASLSDKHNEAYDINQMISVIDEAYNNACKKLDEEWARD